MSALIPNDGERLALLTAVIGGASWLFTKGLPKLWQDRKNSSSAKAVRITRLERENGRLRRALLVLISAIELDVSVDKLKPYVRSARRLIEQGEAAEDAEVHVPTIEEPAQPDAVL